MLYNEFQFMSKHEEEKLEEEQEEEEKQQFSNFKDRVLRLVVKKTLCILTSNISFLW